MCQLRVPGKIKHFWWKVLTGVLPCYGVLTGRRTPVIPQCPLCRIGYDDIQHCLFSCSRASEIWEELGMTKVIQRAVRQDPPGSITMDILLRDRQLVDNIPMAELILIVAVALECKRRIDTRPDAYSYIN